VLDKLAAVNRAEEIAAPAPEKRAAKRPPSKRQ
jgi:hypothetical protein